MMAVSVTHPGLARTENQDRVVIDGKVLASGVSEPVFVDVEMGCLVAVIDGMGGHTAGSVAAAIAADVVASGHRQLRSPADVQALVSTANDELYGMMDRVPALRGMGATIAGLTVASGELIVFNVGDARVYLADAGFLMQASVDDRRPGAGRGAIMQSLGGLPVYTPVQVHTSYEPVGTGRALVASDGLFDAATHEAMTVAIDSSLRGAARALLELALAGGGSDNISFCLIDFAELDSVQEPIAPTRRRLRR